MIRIRFRDDSPSAEAGGGMLSVVAALGLILALVQGSVYYRAKGSARFLGAEKNKVLALQMAEAGVEQNIAEIARRKIRIRSGLTDTVTYDHRALGGGTYTSRLTTVATGPVSDTIDLSSTGIVGTGAQTVQARLRLKKYLDTTRTPLLIVTPETTLTYSTHTRMDTTVLPPKNPATMPDLDKTPAYSACMASSAKKCDVCHLPGGDVTKANVINVSKSAIGTHISHHGDYVTTDGTCDQYMPKTTVAAVTVPDTLRTVVNRTTYDTTIVIDTAVKVQILSWK